MLLQKCLSLTANERIRRQPWGAEMLIHTCFAYLRDAIVHGRTTQAQRTGGCQDTPMRWAGGTAHECALHSPHTYHTGPPHPPFIGAPVQSRAQTSTGEGGRRAGGSRTHISLTLVIYITGEKRETGTTGSRVGGRGGRVGAGDGGAAGARGLPHLSLVLVRQPRPPSAGGRPRALRDGVAEYYNAGAAQPHLRAPQLGRDQAGTGPQHKADEATKHHGAAAAAGQWRQRQRQRLGGACHQGRAGAGGSRLYDRTVSASALIRQRGR